MSGHIPPPPPPGNPPPAGPPSGPGEPGKARIGQSEFAWPVPDRTMTVGGRAISLELVVVAGMYAVGGLIYLILIRDVFSLIPDILSGVFTSNSFEFFFSWAFLYVVGVFLLILVGLFTVAWKVFRADPVGRGLSAVVAGLMLAIVLAGDAPGSVWFVTLLAVAGSAVLFLSPWARRAMAHTASATGKPSPVVLSQSLALPVFALVALVAVVGLIGLRFAGDLGGGFVVAELLLLGAGATGVYGYRLLSTGAKPLARILLTVACGVLLLGVLISDVSAGTLVPIAVLAGIAAPLWLAPSARAYFGDSRTDLLT